MVVGAMSFAVNGFAADTSMSSSTTGTTMQQEAMKTWQSMSPTEKKKSVKN
ncbi:MAG: hypothetical protein HWD59_07205 [Coxiellaceae bacterium]|nr:MAG: hypothetical protein HWD59_07205 [Coxiellaceae bacterium]